MVTYILEHADGEENDENTVLDEELKDDSF